MGKNTSIIRIPTSVNTKFFRYWLDFLKPFHKLADREIEVFAEILKQRILLSRIIKDEEMLDTVVLSDEIKKRVGKACNLSPQHLQVTISKFRKTGLIVGNKINRKFIPDIEEDAQDFRLIIHFELKS